MLLRAPRSGQKGHHCIDQTSKNDVTQSYRKNALKYHPDKNPGDKKAEEKFERENRLRKLKPMKNRMLFFKNGTFRIDTLNRDVQWATEKR